MNAHRCFHPTALAVRILCGSLSLGVGPLLLLAAEAWADEAPLVPSMAFSTGLAGEQNLLSWEAQLGVRYRIRRSGDLGGAAGDGWSERAMVEPATSDGSWLDPEPLGQRAFYWIEPPAPEVFSVEPAVLSPSGGVLLLNAQCLSAGSSLVLEIEGQPPVTTLLDAVGAGRWSASVVGGMVPGGAILSARVVDSSGATVCVIGQNFEITATGRATDAPPELPPAAPVCSWSFGVSQMGTGGHGGGAGAGKWSVGATSPCVSGGGGGGAGKWSFGVSQMGTGGHGGGGGAGKWSFGASQMGTGGHGGGGGAGKATFQDLHLRAGLPGEVCVEQCAFALETPAGPPLDWVQTYRSRGGGGGGGGWTSCFDIRIEPIPLAAGTSASRLYLFGGDGRRDVLYRQPDGSYRCDGMFREGRFVGDSFHLTFADKGTWIFCPLVGAPWSGRIGSIVDRNGVALTCTYNAAAQLESVASQFDASLAMTYGPAGELSSLTDHTGRSVRFEYFGVGEPGGNPGDLKSVSCPQLAGSLPVVGPTTFTYSTGSLDPQLNGNVLDITDGAGQQVCAWTYSSEPDPLDVRYDTCVSALVLRPSDTQDVALRYTAEPIAPGSGSASGGTLWIENDELGRVSETRYDRMHRPVSIRRYTGFAVPGDPVTSTTNRPTGKLRPGHDPDFFETTCTWNPDHCLVRAIAPDGTHHSVLLARELVKDCPVRERGNARVVTLRAPGGEERSVTCDYLPGFGTLETTSSSGLTCRKAGKEQEPYTFRVGPQYDVKKVEGARKASWNVKSMEGARTFGGDGVWDGGDGNGGCTDLIAIPNFIRLRKRAFNSSAESAGRIPGGGGEGVWDGGDGGCTELIAIPNFIRLRKRAFNSSAESAGRVPGGGGGSVWDGGGDGGGCTPLDLLVGTNDGLPNFLDLDADNDGFASRKGYDHYKAKSGMNAAGAQSSPHLTRMLTAHGQVFAWGYDLEGNCTSSRPPVSGSGTDCTYNLFGQCTSVTVLNGPGPSFRDECVYDATTRFLSSVISDKQADGSGLKLVTACLRDAAGRITGLIDPRGFTWLCDYNPLDQVTRTQTPVVGTTAASTISTDYFYDRAGHCRRVDVEHRDATGALVTANPAYSTFFVVEQGHLVQVATEERPVGPPAVPPVLDPTTLGIENFAVCDFLHDSAGQVVRVSTPAGCREQSTDAVLEIAYDECGNLFQTIEGGAYSGLPGATEPVVTQYDYDVLGALVRCTLVAPDGTLGPNCTYTFDAFHRPASATDAMGNVTTYSYDNQGFTTVSHFGEVNDDPGSAGNVLLAHGRGRTQQYTAVGNFSDGQSSRVASSPGGGMPSVKRLLPAIQKIREAAHRFRPAFFDVFVADDVWTWERFAPAEPGPHATETTTVHRSPAGLLLTVTRNGDTLLDCTHDSASRLATCSDGYCVVVVARDACGNVTSSTRTDVSTLAGAPHKTFTYTSTIDPLGRRVTQSDNGGNNQNWDFDSLGRIVRCTEPGGLVTTCDYDGEDPLGAYSVRVVAGDVNGDGLPDELSRALCRSGECRSVTNSNHDATTFTRDALGRTTRCDFPDGTFETFTFSALGHLTQYQRKNGAVIACDFDHRGREVSTVWSNVPVPVVIVEPTLRRYDGLDRLTRCEQGTSPPTSSVLAWTHDSLGNELSEAHNGLAITRTFNHRGRTAIVYPDGSTFVESRTSLGHLTSCSAVDSTGTVLTPPVVTLDYSGHRVTTSTQANGVVTTFDFRADGQAPPPGGGDDFSFDTRVRSTITGPNSVVLSDTIRRRNRNQAVVRCDTAFSTTAQSAGRRKTFTLDPLDRVIGCDTVRREAAGGPVIPESSVTYTLDLEGRRLSAVGGLHPGDYFQNKLIPPGDRQMSQYSSWQDDPLDPLDSPDPLEWDTNGCLISLTDGSTHFQCVYDSASRLVAVNDPATGQDIATYAYDGVGRRTRSTLIGTVPVTTFFVFDGDECVQELGTDGLADMTFATGGTGFKHCISTRNGTLYYPNGGSTERITKISAITLRFAKCVSSSDCDFTNSPGGGTTPPDMVTSSGGVPVERLARDDGGQPIFLDPDGRPRQGATTALTGLRWLAPECAWCPETGFFQCPDGVYSPALGQDISAHKEKPKPKPSTSEVKAGWNLGTIKKI